MLKRIIALVCALALCFISIGQTAYAEGAGDHWKDIRRVLFNKEAYSTNKAVKDKQIIIERASQLCIDQFGGSGNAYLKELMNKGVPKLPDTINEIDLIASTNNHRAPTHQGWNAQYGNTNENPDWTTKWEKRQNIMRNSVKYVFDWNTNKFFHSATAQWEEEQCEAFCVLLYCVHILGDHHEYTLSSYRSHKGKILPMSSVYGPSVISELESAFEVLFSKQNWTELKIELETKKIEINEIIYNLEDGMLTEEEFEIYRTKAEDILDILSKNCPKLLLENEYFEKAFGKY